MSPLRVILPTAADYAAQIAAVQQRLHAGGLVARGSGELDVPRIVTEILTEVQKGGDAAAARLASKLDRATLSAETLRVPEETLAQARAQADESFFSLLREAADNIRAYQQQILHREPAPLQRGGRTLSVRYTAIERVGVYVPGGQAFYPSTVLMTVIPALVAGVQEIALFTPATGGEIQPLALALAKELGIREVYRLGGAVAIAAAAFGTESIRPVHKVVGPGNAFVAEAKRQLFGRVGIDSIAGPSEVLIIADDSADPRWVATDLLAQAEHDPGSALLVTPSLEFGQRVAVAVEAELARLERADAIRNSLEKYSAIIVCKDLVAASDIANRFATEHLQIVTRENAACLQRIRHAGAIFLGPHAPVPLGDYFAGPSHVLPTGGTAKFFGPLSCNDFLKASSVIEYDASSLEQDAPKVRDFALQEGLSAHAHAVMVRTLPPADKERV